MLVKEATASSFIYLELHTYIVKNSLLKHQSLQYGMCSYFEYENNQVNNTQKMENTGGKVTFNEL